MMFTCGINVLGGFGCNGPSLGPHTYTSSITFCLYKRLSNVKRDVCFGPEPETRFRIRTSAVVAPAPAVEKVSITLSLSLARSETLTQYSFKIDVGGRKAFPLCVSSHLSLSLFRNPKLLFLESEIDLQYSIIEVYR